MTVLCINPNLKTNAKLESRVHFGWLICFWYLAWDYGRLFSPEKFTTLSHQNTLVELPLYVASEGP